MRDLLQRFKKRKILNLTVASLFMALQMPLGLIGTNSVLAATEQSAAVQNEAAVLKADNRNEAAENAPNQESENTSELNQEQPILNENQPSEESNVPDNQGTEQAPGLKEEHESQDVNQENQNQAPQVLQLVSEESEGPMVTLCHATGSTTNPFVRITISVSGAFNGHLGNDHQLGEDIIPSFEYKGNAYSQNWDTEGQAIWNNGCVKEAEEEPVETKVTLCHATGSESNPFVEITVSAAGAFNGHLGNDHQLGEDIIPPFEFNGVTYSQNWDAEGQAIFRNDCVQANNNNPEEDKVTLCHATGSTTNPFVRITISVSGAFNGHLGNDHQNGEDIIPPFEFEGQTYSQNWDVAGQATFNNNCVRPSGGQGGGEVLGESTTVTPTGAVLGASTQLANTGESTMSGLFVALAILGLTGISAYSTRRRYNL